jgi:hypothetical protein
MAIRTGIETQTQLNLVYALEQKTKEKKEELKEI